VSRRHSQRRSRTPTVEVNPLFRPTERRPDRKTLQLCEQVKDTLNWVLGSVDDQLILSHVQAVEPLPGGRLLVKVTVPPDVSIPEAMTSLAAAAPALRAEVAQAITRRKAPELVYVAVPAG
jgi:ribosome-binding factor A